LASMEKSKIVDVEAATVMETTPASPAEKMAA
jgi:hypothetical protein